MYVEGNYIFSSIEHTYNCTNETALLKESKIKQVSKQRVIKVSLIHVYLYTGINRTTVLYGVDFQNNSICLSVYYFKIDNMVTNVTHPSILTSNVAYITNDNLFSYAAFIIISLNEESHRMAFC